MKRLMDFLEQEWRKLVKFVIIGGLSFLLYAGIYAAISRWVWPTGNRSVENFLAICLASVFNFTAHRGWTFRSNGSRGKQIPRYLVVMFTAMGLQTFLFWFGHEVLHYYDFLVVFVVGAMVPLYTYGMHRWFVFRHETAAVPVETQA